MIVLFCFLIILCNYSCNTHVITNVKSETIENVYIDTLVQRYLKEEKYLWDLIYANSSNRIDQNVYYLMNKIRSNHLDILNDEYLEYVMSEVYMGKFIKYLDFYHIHNAADEYEQLILTKSRPESYMTVDMAFGVYNNNPEDMLFEKIAEDSKLACTNWSSEVDASNHNLYMFYEILSANVLTTYMKSQRFNMLQVIKNGFESHDSEILRAKFNSLYNEITDVAKYYMRAGSTLMWMCDENAAYDYGSSRQITNFLRGYVDNQINLNKDGSCWGTCSDYKFARNYGCYNGTFCDEQKKIGESEPTCKGTIIDCSYIDKKMEVCPSVSGRNRRYEYINYGCTLTDRLNQTRCKEDGRYFGLSGNCETRTSTLESFRNVWLMKCDYCFCYCDEHDVDSDRYFSLQPVVSDVWDNMIVSGVAIKKRNGIFSWTITQSKLLTHGRVEQFQTQLRSNVKYSNFKRTDPGVMDGVDYHTLHWHSRSVNLDVIPLPHGSVVTGVRFVAYRGVLSVEIRSTKFDFNSGLLFDDHDWVSRGSPKEKTNLQLDRPGPSDYYDTYGTFMSVPDFRPNKFIKFRPSDPDKDAGQTTVPFIDTQMVRPRNLTPLSGVGIYYKGKDGLGGFIAPTVLVYEMLEHMGKTKSVPLFSSSETSFN